VLSVNVGLPKDVAWHGKTVHTAVWKRPVAGPGQVRRLNIDGDGQGDLAGHGGEHRAVFVYQIESYRYWQQQLTRDDFCETALMFGTVGYSPDPIDEPAEGSVLICCSQPSADLVLDL